MKRLTLLILLLFGFLTVSVLAQDDFPSPYPVGIRLKAVCKLADAAHKVST